MSETGRNIELTKGDARICVELDHGARIGSLRVRGLELLVEADAVASEGASPFLWGCYPMAPFAGRVRDGRFEWEGTAHQLRLGMPPHAIHGTVFDRRWNWASGGPQEPLDSAETIEVALETPLGEDWPFEGRAVQRIALGRDQLRMQLEVHSEGAAFPASLGWHPWFRRRLERGEAAELEFAAASMYVRDGDGLPTGETAEPVPGPWDDCFTGVGSNPLLRWPGALELELCSDARYWVVYDVPAHAICVEPQTAPPDVFNLASEQPARVAPGAPLIGEFVLRWRSLD